MNRDRQDDAVRGLARATDEQVARAAGPEARAAVLEGIVHMPTTTTPARRRTRLRPALALAGVTLAATGAIGWSQFMRDPADTTALLCEIRNSPSIVDAVSGDPVADCAAEWVRQTGHEAPALAAYDNGRGGVAVRPAADPVPAGYKPLRPGGQNLALIQLDESLADHVAGLNSRCFSPAEATAFAQAQLTRYGITGWAVTADRAAGSRCVDAAAVDLDGRKVVLIGGSIDPSEADTKYNRLAERLRTIAKKCRTLPDAAAKVDQAVRELGLSTSPSFREVSVTSVRTDERCTTIRQRVGGGITVTLRGPAG